MQTMQLTGRQERERAFYERVSKLTGDDEVSLEPVSSTKPRPWNSYWFTYDLAAKERLRGAETLLDFGCGTGHAAIRCAKLGYDVHGFDIAPGNIRQAEFLARKYGCDAQTSFSVQVAEALSYPSNFFDVVVGIDILHHIDVGPAIRECMRVLKPDGVAIFREYVEVPVLDRIRNTWLLRRLVPNDASEELDHQITEDERKLSAADLRGIEEACGRMTTKRFQLLSRLNRFLRTPNAPEPSSLEQLDDLLLRIPWLAKAGGSLVLRLEKKSEFCLI